jgi:hypothetical protein
MMRALGLAWLASLVAWSGAFTQELDSRRALCFRPHVQRCENYLIIEMSGMRPLVSTTVTRGTDTRPDFGGELSWPIGVARVLPGRRSIGGVVLVEAERDFFGGAQARYRQWSSERSAFELSFGYATDVLAMKSRGHGVHAGFALIPTRNYALHASARVMRAPGRTAATVMGGASLYGAGAIATTAVWGYLARGLRGW